MKGLSSVWKGMLAAFTACTIFGFSFMFSRLAYEQADRMIGLSWRFFIAVVMLNLMLLAGRLRLPGCGGFRLKLRQVTARDWGLLLLLGMCEPVLYFIGESIGIKLTNSSFTAVMIAVIPLASSLLAAFWLKEIPNLKQALFAVLSVSGVVVVSLIGAGQGTVTLPGVLALLLAVVTGAVYTNLSRFLSHFTPFERTYVIFSLGLVWFLVSALLHGFGFREIWAARTLPRFLISVFYLGAFSTVVAYYLMNYSLSVLPIARSTAFTNWTTVVSILAGIIFLKEPFTLWQGVGSALILLGLWGANYFADDPLPSGALEEQS